MAPTALQFKAIAPAVYAALEQLERTGWVESGVTTPETVEAHTEALVRLARELAPQLTAAERDGLLEMLEVHDWPEALCGDEVILETHAGEQGERQHAKRTRERAAMQTLCAGLPEGDQFYSWWERFETADDPAARFARELDKYQAVEQALAYEAAQGIPLFRELYDYTDHAVTHPLLRARMAALMTRWQAQSGGAGDGARA